MSSRRGGGPSRDREAGIEILADGGRPPPTRPSRRRLASCVAETVMTGSARRRSRDLLGRAAASGAEPRLLRRRAGPRAASAAPLSSSRCRSATELVHYAVGIGSCGVPGVPAGLDALWRAHGRLPWQRLVEPALRLARDGVPMPRGARRVPRDARAGDDDARGRADLRAGRARCSRPRATGSSSRGSSRALELVAEEGARSVYDAGSIAEALLALMDERGGLVTREDLAAYEASWSEPVEVALRRHADRSTRAGLAPVGETLAAPAAALRDRRAERVGRALVRRSTDAGDADGDTTNLTVVDADGNACVLTTSLGLGSGDYLPGLDLHLNSMLGEADLITAARAGRPDGEHDGADARARRRRARARDRRGRRDAAAQRARRRSLAASSTRASSRRRRSTRARSTRSAASSTLEPGLRRGRRSSRSRPPGFAVRRWPTRAPLLRRRQRRHAGGRRPVTHDGAALQRRFLHAEGRPADVPALGAAGVRADGSSAGRSPPRRLSRRPGRTRGSGRSSTTQESGRRAAFCRSSRQRGSRGLRKLALGSNRSDGAARSASTSRAICAISSSSLSNARSSRRRSPELDDEPLAVEVALEVEQERLDPPLARRRSAG